MRQHTRSEPLRDHHERSDTTLTPERHRRRRVATGALALLGAALIVALLAAVL